MRKLFYVYAARKHGMGSAGAYFSLPAAPYEMRDVREKLGIQAGEPVRAEVEKYFRFACLAPDLGGEHCDLGEWNALAWKLSELDERQSTAFEGLLKMEADAGGPIPMSRLIDLAYSTDCCHVVPEATNDAQLGRFYAENDFVPDTQQISDRLFDLLDFEKIGQELRQGEGGVFTEGGYVVRHSDLARAYQDLDLTEQKPGYVFRLNLSNLENPRIPAVHLDFPATERERSAALEQLGAAGWGGVEFQVEDSALPGFLDGVDCIERFNQVNELAESIQSVEKAGQLPKYKAVLEAVRCVDLDGALRLAAHLDEYLLEPEFRTPEDVALDELREVLDEPALKELLPCVDLRSYGQNLIQRRDYALTEYGLTSRADGQPLHSMEKQPGWSGGMEMK